MTTNTHDERAEQDHGEPAEAHGQPGECEPIRTTVKEKKGVELSCTCNFCLRMRELYMEHGWFSLFIAK